MKQIYKPYWEWECHKNGMYRDATDTDIKKAFQLMKQSSLFSEAMRKVIKEWPDTMLNHLSNESINKKAFLGQCACSYWINVPESATKKAWWILAEEKRTLANREAQKHIDKWNKDYERKNKKIRKDMGDQMLFEWDT